MKIKVRPEDFQVEEIAYLPLSEDGPYRVYHLKKWGWNTLDLLRRLSRTLNVPFQAISYGGKKDRYALTTQYITIKDRREFNIKEKYYTLVPIGTMYRPMGPDLIRGNRFRITVRKLREQDTRRVAEASAEVSRWGFINYFDDQRFGSYAPKQGFIAEKILLDRPLDALRIILTHIYPEDKKAERQRKRRLRECWGDWQRCLEVSETGFEKNIFSTLLRGRDPRDALRLIGREELSMYVAAYQAFLWNETARRLTVQVSRRILRYRGIAGDYLFYRTPEIEEFSYLKDLTIPVVSDSMVFQDKRTSRLLEEILEERGLKGVKFNRKVVVIPEDLQCSSETDEVYSNYRAIRLSFTLPKGSYGTMLLKRLFAIECDIIRK